MHDTEITEKLYAQAIRDCIISGNSQTDVTGKAKHDTLLKGGINT